MDIWTRSQVITALLSYVIAPLPKKDVISSWKRNAKKYHRMAERELIEHFVVNILIPQDVDSFIFENKKKQLEIVEILESPGLKINGIESDYEYF